MRRVDLGSERDLGIRSRAARHRDQVRAMGDGTGDPILEEKGYNWVQKKAVYLSLRVVDGWGSKDMDGDRKRYSKQLNSGAELDKT